MTTEEFKLRVLPTKDKLYRLAASMLNDREDARDVVQEVLLRLWIKQDDVRKYRSVEAFAMVMARNLCLDRIKSKGYGHSELTYSNEPVSPETPERITELRDTADHVHRIIRQLPEQQRMIVQMRDVEEMAFEEIAEIMQMNVNAVRVNLSRARKQIRDQLIKKQSYEYK